MTEQIAAKLQEIARLDQKIIANKTYLSETPFANAIAKYQSVRDEIVKSLKEELKESPGVIATPAGHVGFEIRRSVSYSPAIIREKLPELAHLIITEAVDKDRLSKLAGAAVKCGVYPEGHLDALAESAEVKETKAWILDLAEPPNEGEEAPKEAPKRGRGKKKTEEPAPVESCGPMVPSEEVEPASGDPEYEAAGFRAIEKYKGMTADEMGKAMKAEKAAVPEPPANEAAPALPEEPREPIPAIITNLLTLSEKNREAVIRDMSAERLDEALRAIPLPPRTTTEEQQLYRLLADQMLKKNPKYLDPMSADMMSHRPAPFPCATLSEPLIIERMNALPQRPSERSPEQQTEYQSLADEMRLRIADWQDPNIVIPVEFPGESDSLKLPSFVSQADPLGDGIGF